jgi:hypothetical protein
MDAISLRHGPSANQRMKKLLITLSCIGATLGCAAAPAVSPTADGTPEAEDWSRCYAGFSPTGNPKSDLRRLTQSCGRLGHMRPITAVRVGEQAAREPADSYTFFVPEAGNCFRIFATADRNVHDLDVLLKTQDGEALAGDITHDTWPVVPPQGPACFEDPGLYVLEISVFSGAGRYALQVWAY